MVDQPPSAAIGLTGDGVHGRFRARKLTAGLLGGRGRRGSPHHGVELQRGARDLIGNDDE
jgi:hypothetical protein